MKSSIKKYKWQQWIYKWKKYTKDNNADINHNTIYNEIETN